MLRALPFTGIATLAGACALAWPSEMRFGRIASTATAGTVRLVRPATLATTQPTTASPTIGGNRVATGGALLVGGGACSATNNCGVGAVQIAGAPSGTFATVTSPASITLTSGANSMLVNTFRRRYGAPGTAGVTTGTGSFSTLGRATLILAATLQVNANQPSGTYTGIMLVTVNY
jgi:Mat/Ecp fimbriae major subunit